MKRLLMFLMSFVGTTAFADTETINWYVDGNTYTTTMCEAGGDIILPTPPEKYGYTFKGWLNFTPIEYIESTGTQYIDTGVIPNVNTNFDIEFIQNNDKPDECPMGSRVNAYNNQMLFFFGKTNNILYVNIGTDETQVSVNFSFSSLKTAIMQNRIFSLKESDTGQTLISIDFNHVSQSQLNNSLSLYLFSANQNNKPNRPFEGKIYYAKFWDNDVLIRNFIPVIDNNNVPCMFDLVENKCYYNAGTGDFIAGPVINSLGE